MASTNGITIRSSTRDDWPAVVNLLETGFGQRYDQAELDIIPDLFTPGRALLAMDGDRIVGHTVDRQMTVTVPGGRTVAASGISAVAVAPTHRRRGILRALYTEQHARTEAERLPLTIFTASEGTIYGRFGYGTAIERDFVSIDRHRVQFRPTTPDPGGVEIAALDERTRSRIRDVYDRWRRLVPGAQERPDASWRLCFADPPRFRGGASTLYALLHPDGYVLYRREWGERESVAIVWEFRAVTAEAHVAMWRVLLGLDLVDRVVCDLADHDPLPYLFTDPRLARVTGRRDHLWLRIMDVPAALTARTYRQDLDVVVGVHDPFRDAGGTFALRVHDGIAECAPTTRTVELELGIAELSSLYLGGHRARVLAAANRIRVKDPATLRAVDEAFTTDRDAELGWPF